jgi:succinyl-CoA synthetase beta subunit
MKIKGLTVEKVLVAPAEDIASEAYVGIIVDRASKRAVFMVSAQGGIDIEEVAATNPEAIQKLASSRLIRATGCSHSRRTISPRTCTRIWVSSGRARRS